MNLSADNTRKLDNPIWFALNETHKQFALGNENIKCYDPGYCPFGGISKAEDVQEFLFAYAHLTGGFYIIGERPACALPLKIDGKLDGLQMIMHKTVGLDFTEEIINLGNEFLEDVSALVNLVQPGYFRKNTFLLGNYYGIFKNGKLVSVTGERMQMDSFIEVSAVVTHPGFTGRGYAQQLVAHTINQILAQHKTPILHVLESNVGAIKLYEKLGFATRRKMSFWHLSL